MEITVKKARHLMGLTQKEMAEIMGVHVQTYMKWEKNPDEMTIATAKRFSHIVNIGIDQIFFDRESNLIRQKRERRKTTK